MLNPEQCRAARGLLDWSQNQLACSAEVSRQTVVDFERGERNPRNANLRAIQNTLEREGIEFINTGYNGPAVRLRPSIWRLKPVDKESLNWKASIYCGEVVIRAPSERRARQIATMAFGIAVSRAPGKRIISNPWNRLIGEATCERLANTKYQKIGPDEILFPKKYDLEWKR